MIHIAHGGTKFQKPDERLPNQFLPSTNVLKAKPITWKPLKMNQQVNDILFTASAQATPSTIVNPLLKLSPMRISPYTAIQTKKEPVMEPSHGKCFSKGR